MTGLPLLWLTVTVLLTAPFLAACNDETADSSAHLPLPAVPVPQQATQTLHTLDEFYGELASRVIDQMGGELEDFKITQSPGAWSVGTVLRAGRSVPVSYSSCRPPDADREVASTPAPTLFPAYRMSRRVAGGIGLDESVFHGVATLGASAEDTTEIGLQIGNPQIRMWSDVGLGKMLTTQTCREDLELGKTYRIVRGLVIGQRTFTFGAKRAAQASAGAVKIANFNVQTGDDGAVSVTDESPQGFLAMVSEFTLSTDERIAPEISAPGLTGEEVGKIILQGDDTADNRSLEQLVTPLGAEVEFDHVRDPTASYLARASAEIRYFRGEDEAKALVALGALKSEFPNVRLTQINLPAPPGQLEIVLPESGRKPDVEPVCSYISIRELGWRSGHKTNFCKANGYAQGNFNQGDYKNGGICMAGPEPDVCRNHVQGRTDAAIHCSRDGRRTECFRIPAVGSQNPSGDATWLPAVADAR